MQRLNSVWTSVAGIMIENREMQEDLFRKFDDWFKMGQKRALLIAACTGQGAPERHAGWGVDGIVADDPEMLVKQGERGGQ